MQTLNPSVLLTNLATFYEFTVGKYMSAILHCRKIVEKVLFYVEAASFYIEFKKEDSDTIHCKSLFEQRGH